jgi:hypothetical protein
MSDGGAEPTYYKYYSKTPIPTWIKWVALVTVLLAIILW